MGRTLPAMLVVVPVVVLALQLAFLEPMASSARNRVVANSAPLIAEIESWLRARLRLEVPAAEHCRIARPGRRRASSVPAIDGQPTLLVDRPQAVTRSARYLLWEHCSITTRHWPACLSQIITQRWSSLKAEPLNDPAP